MYQQDTSRTQSSQAKQNKDTGKNSFSARAQSSAAKNENLTRQQEQQNQQAGATYQGQQDSLK